MQADGRGWWESHCSQWQSFLTFGLSQAKIGWYVDCPSIILIVCICAACVLFSGRRTKYEVVHFLRKTVLPAGLVVMVIMVPALLHSLSDPAAIGPNIAVMVLTLLYAAVAYLCTFYVAETRMERRRKAELARRLCGYGEESPWWLSVSQRQYKTARTELAGICY